MVGLKIVLVCLGILAYLFLVIFFRRYRQWLPYYVLGAFGLVLILIFGVKAFKGEDVLSFAHLYPLQFLLNTVGVTAKVFYPEKLMVANPTSFSLLTVNIECSSLIEFSILAGLVLFYPVFRPSQKVLFLFFGLFSIYILNLLRILVITTIIHMYGEPAVFIAHAVVGRLFFFAGIVILTWYIFTQPSLTATKQRIEGALA